MDRIRNKLVICFFVKSVESNNSNNAMQKNQSFLCLCLLAFKPTQFQFINFKLFSLFWISHLFLRFSIDFIVIHWWLIVEVPVLWWVWLQGLMMTNEEKGGEVRDERDERGEIEI